MADESKPAATSADSATTATVPSAAVGATTTAATAGQPAVPVLNKTAKGRPLMSVKVYAPFKVYYEGDAFSITAVNETGPFDILPRHHNFLCMLIPCDLIIQAPDETRTVKIARALMHVKAERVVLYVDV